MLNRDLEVSGLQDVLASPAGPPSPLHPGVQHVVPLFSHPLGCREDPYSADLGRCGPQSCWHVFSPRLTRGLARLALPGWQVPRLLMLIFKCEQA